MTSDETEPAYTEENWPQSESKSKFARKSKKASKRSKRTPRKKPLYKHQWKGLPDNAPTKVEADWVAANLDDALEERVDGVARINFAKCTTNPPSRAAIMMLKIAAKDPDAFVLKRLAASGKNVVVDVHEMERRDKMQVAEIKEILGQFEDAGKR